MAYRILSLNHGGDVLAAGSPEVSKYMLEWTPVTKAMERIADLPDSGEHQVGGPHAFPLWNSKLFQVQLAGSDTATKSRHRASSQLGW
jgi:hypothetical protein